jgi:hypothetical protein
MRKAEIILVITIVAGIAGNLFWIEYSNEIFMIGCSLLATMYFYLGFALFNEVPFRQIFKKASYKDISSGRIIGSIGLGIVFSIIIIGFQFKFLLLPGSHEMLIIGNEFLTVVTIVAAFMFFIRHKGKSEFYPRNFKRMIPILCIGLFTYWLPLDTLIDIRYRDRPKYAELLKQSIENPEDEELRNKLQEQRKKSNY